MIRKTHTQGAPPKVGLPDMEDLDSKSVLISGVQ